MLRLIFSKHVSQKSWAETPSTNPQPSALFLWSRKPGCRLGFNIKPVLSQCVTQKKPNIHYHSERVLEQRSWALRGLWEPTTHWHRHSQLHAIVLNQLSAGRKTIKLGKGGATEGNSNLLFKIWTLRKNNCSEMPSIFVFFIGSVLLTMQIYVNLTFTGFMFFIIFVIYELQKLVQLVIEKRTVRLLSYENNHYLQP